MAATRISPAETRERLRARPPALLVCAYDDEQKCAAMRIPGSLTLQELNARLSSLPVTQEIVFYCG